MKRFIILCAIAMATAVTFAQNKEIPAGLRMEVAEAEIDEHYQSSIFTYKDEDGTFGYYLSVSHVYELLKMVRDDITDMSVAHVDETILCIGSTPEEAFAFTDSLLALLDKAPGTTVQFPCRLATGADRLGASSTATCIVVKRFLQKKRLCFHFTSGNRTAEADLNKSSVKSLRLSFKVNHKLHPNG